MTRRLMLATCAALALVLPVQAHEGHPHKILGTVSAVATDRVTLKVRQGMDVTVHLSPATKVLRDKKPVTLQDIQKGSRVVVTAVTEKPDGTERMRATIIELGAAPAAK